MPAERGSTVLCDLVELHGESLVNLIEIVESVTGDGLVEPDESRLLKSVMVLTAQTYEPLPARAAQNDDAWRLVGAASGAGRVTKHVFAVAREAAADLRDAA
jgi:hypothetical protein